VTGRDQVQTALACLGLDTADPEPPAGRLRCASSATQHGEVPNREILRRHRAISQQVQKGVWFVLGEDAMTFTIYASKNGQSVVTVRISPAVAVDRARVLKSLGWQVHVTDSAGRRFTPSEFDWLSSLAGQTA
jgi:hypothetical protein